MIQITAYLRTEEDLKLWKEVENKTQFLHNALQGIHDKVVPIHEKDKEIVVPKSKPDMDIFKEPIYTKPEPTA
jgi:hypothetical protein